MVEHLLGGRSFDWVQGEADFDEIYSRRAELPGLWKLRYVVTLPVNASVLAPIFHCGTNILPNLKENCPAKLRQLVTRPQMRV